MTEEVITREEYEGLLEKLEQIEANIDEAVQKKSDEQDTESKIEKLLGEARDSLVEKFEELSAQLLDSKETKEEEPVDVEKVVKEAIKEATEPLEKRIEVLENSPVYKGKKDGDEGEPGKEDDILSNVIKSAYGIRSG